MPRVTHHRRRTFHKGKIPLLTIHAMKAAGVRVLHRATTVTHVLSDSMRHTKKKEETATSRELKVDAATEEKSSLTADLQIEEADVELPPAFERALSTDVEPASVTEKVLGYLYIFAGVLFVLGSILFLPDMPAPSYAVGVYLYFIGGLLYMSTALFDLEEAIIHGPHFFDVSMNCMYCLGTGAYLLATIYYLPVVSDAVGSFEAALVGSTGFVVGSTLFVFACFLNGAHSSDHFSTTAHAVLMEKVLVLATTNSTMMGSILFLVGSVLYMPVIGCSEGTEVIGTWLYLIGSVLFTIAGILPVVRRVVFEEDCKAFKTGCLATCYGNTKSGGAAASTHKYTEITVTATGGGHH